MRVFAAEERDSLNQKLENYLRPVRFRESSAHPDATDGRTPFDSDFARVALSAPVRRLQDKTQVFPLPYYDFVRNRLTHSLEVLCIARGLGLGVEKVLSQNGLFEVGKIPQYHHAITSILETAALVHDIGNPPFGHKIEKAIQAYFKNIPNLFIKKNFDKLSDSQKADLLNIEGNVQGFRILRHLALAKDEFSYNLTMPTMATIVKYPYSSLRGNKDSKEGYPHEQEKFGYLNAEENEYFKICDTLGMRHEGHRHPLTYLLEAADDIAYSVCDLEDVYKNGLIETAQIKKTFEQFKKEYKKNNNYSFSDTKIEDLFFNLESDDMLTEEINMQNLRIQLQSKMIVECTKTFCEHYQEIMDGRYKGELLEDCGCDVRILKKVCKEIVSSIFDSPDIHQKIEEAINAAKYILTGLLNAILLLNVNTPLDAPEYLLYQKISRNYRKVACEIGVNVPTNTYKKFLLATDYVFGMTDSFLMNIYNDDGATHDLILRVQSKIDNMKI